MVMLKMWTGGKPEEVSVIGLFMLVLVLGASMPVMFVGWEGVGLCSYLLIGFYFLRKSAADAGKKAFIVNRIGDFGFLDLDDGVQDALEIMRRRGDHPR